AGHALPVGGDIPLDQPVDQPHDARALSKTVSSAVRGTSRTCGCSPSSWNSAHPPTHRESNTTAQPTAHLLIRNAPPTTPSRDATRRTTGKRIGPPQIAYTPGDETSSHRRNAHTANVAAVSGDWSTGTCRSQACAPASAL